MSQMQNKHCDADLRHKAVKKVQNILVNELKTMAWENITIRLEIIEIAHEVS